MEKLNPQDKSEYIAVVEPKDMIRTVTTLFQALNSAVVKEYQGFPNNDIETKDTLRRT